MQLGYSQRQTRRAEQAARASREQQAPFDKRLTFSEKAPSRALSTPMGVWSFGARPPLSDMKNEQSSCQTLCRFGRQLRSVEVADPNPIHRGSCFIVLTTKSRRFRWFTVVASRPRIMSRIDPTPIGQLDSLVSAPWIRTPHVHLRALRARTHGAWAHPFVGQRPIVGSQPLCIVEDFGEAVFRGAKQPLGRNSLRFDKSRDFQCSAAWHANCPVMFTSEVSESKRAAFESKEPHHGRPGCARGDSNC
jgi:hypothetical protein